MTVIAEIQVAPSPPGTPDDPHAHVEAAIAVIKASGLRPPTVRWTWVPRAENKRADALVNAALDGAPVRRDEPLPLRI